MAGPRRPIHTSDPDAIWPLVILVVAILLALALGGCSQQEGEKIQPKRQMEEFTLKVVMLHRQQVVDTCVRLGAWPAAYAQAAAKNRPVGCAVAIPEEKRCTVYVPRPLFVDDQNTTVLGHEVLHCVIGPYHANSPPG
jgi:hypothetical protein